MKRLTKQRLLLALVLTVSALPVTAQLNCDGITNMYGIFNRKTASPTRSTYIATINYLTGGIGGALGGQYTMILKAKNQFSENGKLYLLWGWVILFCSLGYFILAEIVHYSRPYAIWTLSWIAMIYMFIYLRREGKRKVVKTYTQDILGYIWIAFIIM